MSSFSLLFCCQRCGSCCHGETTVSLNEDDIKRMAGVLDVSLDELRQRYLRITGNIVQMQTIDGHCIFYDQGCKVHAGRPWRCAQWPLHPSILTDENNYLTISASCPGIHKNLSYQDFCNNLRTFLNDPDCRS